MQGDVSRLAEEWDAQHQSEDRLLKYMHRKRAKEFHARGSGGRVETGEIKVGSGSFYSDKAGKVEAWGSPSALMGVDVDVTIFKQKHLFNVFGANLPVTEVYAKYLTVLEQMVAQFEADTWP